MNTISRPTGPSPITLGQDALDEFLRWTDFVPPLEWIALLLNDTPTTARELTPHERAVVETFAIVLNAQHKNGPQAILDELRRALRGNSMLRAPDIEARIVAQADDLVRGFLLNPYDGTGHHTAFVPSPYPAETVLVPHAGDTFEQTLAEHISRYGLGYPLDWIEETLPQLAEPALGRAARSTVRYLHFVREKMRPVESPRGDGATYHGGMALMRNATCKLLGKLLDALGENYRVATARDLTEATLEVALMAYENDIWPWDRSKIPDMVVTRVRSIASFGVAQLRKAVSADPTRAAIVFTERLNEYRQLVRVLRTFGGLGFTLRQLVQLLRTIPVPVVERNLSYWGTPTTRTVPFDTVAMDLIHSIHVLSPGLGEESPTTSEARVEFADFCLGRIGQKKGEHTRDGFAVTGTLVEPNPAWRQCYLHAVMALRANPEGKGQNVASWAMNHDPDEATRMAAKETYSLLRKTPSTTTADSPRRSLLTAVWWLLQAQILALGEPLDLDGSRLTLSDFMRRTTERSRPH